MQKKTEKPKIKKTSIGGQAVIEGVMMRGSSSVATAVRDSDGIIRLEAKRLQKTKRSRFLTLPVIRGVVNFVDSMATGIRTLTRSAEVFGEGEPSKFEKWLSKKCKIDLMSAVITISMILGIGLAVVLFIVLPTFLTGLIVSNKENGGLFTLIEGIIKLGIFILYIFLTSLLNDIKRTFMYHGAEHKTISCYEKGEELSVANVKKCSRVHNRCGTTFIFFVVFISIIVFMCVSIFIPPFADNLLGKVERILLKLALLPLVAGLSYELLKALAKTESPIFYPLKAPGLLLQRLTTREPDNSMIEVAITSFNKVLKMDADENEPEENFTVTEKLDRVLEEIKAEFAEKKIDESDAEWIVALSLNIHRSELSENRSVSPKQQDIINARVRERLSMKPLWYIIGDVDFYGAKIDVDERVLIPRFETEEVVENALKVIKPNDLVLDLCTGSGAIAIAVKMQCPAAEIYASDISADALAVARKNAENNSVDITFIESNLFESIDKRFSVIISNPPYVKDGDLDELQAEVRDYEPKLALLGGADGLDFYRRICLDAKERLFDGGILFLECGLGQANKISKMLCDWTSCEIIKDLNGIDRIVKAVL